MKRRHVLPFFEKLPPSLIGIEACVGVRPGNVRYGPFPWSRRNAYAPPPAAIRAVLRGQDPG